MTFKNKFFLRFQTNGKNLTVFLTGLDQLKEYTKVGSTISIYPLESNVASQNFEFEPFEDYVSELVAGRRSTYRIITNYADKTFGLIVAGFISIIFSLVLPYGLNSVEAVVGVLGAYAIGKELWLDIDRFLQDLSRDKKISWAEKEYFYIREEFGTIQNFWHIARQKRYGYTLTLPKKIDFVAHSNSKTIDMLFSTSDWAKMYDDQVRILNVVFSKKLTHQNKLMISCQLSLTQNWMGISQVTEIYQGLNNSQAGLAHKDKTWYPDKLLIKKSIRLGQLKMTWYSQELPGKLFN